jgi:hypothetical protein
VKIIPLTQGKVAKVDDEDVIFLCQWKWHYSASDGYAKTNMHTRNGKRVIGMHRLLQPALPELYQEVDHINGDKLDNRKSNLRTVTRRQNSLNRPLPKTNKSGYRGVAWNKKTGRWRAIFKFRGKQVHVGYFDDPAEAHKAYLAALPEEMRQYHRKDENIDINNQKQ